MALGGAAATAGAAVLGSRLLTSRAVIAGSATDWASPLGTSRGLAAHLLRRAGFAYTASDLDQAASMKYSDLVDSIVSQKADPMPAPPMLTSYTSVGTTWLQHMATTHSQFPERMVLFWHGHLTSDYRKANRFPYVYFQNQLYRNAGMGDLRTLLNEVTFDPLMMVYLDLQQSSGKAPNENYSRELMELYTLGVGNYTENDVREGARAFSGIRVVLRDSSGAVIKPPRRGKGPNAINDYYRQIDQLAQSGATWRGQLNPRLHDSGSKTFLGRSGNLGPSEAIDAILAQHACAPFVTTAAMTYFGVPTPSSSTVNSIADQFRNSKYDIKTLMRAIFTSSDFTDPGNYRSLVRSPVDFMVAGMRILNNNALAKQALQFGQTMDQILYDPPTVAGWPQNGAWLSSSSALSRVNFASTAVAATPQLPPVSDAISTHLDNVVGPDLANVFNASTTDEDRWYAVLASAEFQLK